MPRDSKVRYSIDRKWLDDSTSLLSIKNIRANPSTNSTSHREGVGGNFTNRVEDYSLDL